jgi:uncharacterized membrane-anchored protein
MDNSKTVVTNMFGPNFFLRKPTTYRIITAIFLLWVLWFFILFPNDNFLSNSENDKLEWLLRTVTGVVLTFVGVGTIFYWPNHMPVTYGKE